MRVEIDKVAFENGAGGRVVVKRWKEPDEDDVMDADSEGEEAEGFYEEIGTIEAEKWEEVIAEMSMRPMSPDLERAAREVHEGQGAIPRKRPRIVTLCGSTRFALAYGHWYGRLTDAGYVVLSVGRFKPVRGWDETQKRRLDELHLRKIDLSDEIFVLDVKGYVGESTKKEIEYALAQRVVVRFLNTEHPGWTENDISMEQIEVS